MSGEALAHANHGAVPHQLYSSVVLLAGSFLLLRSAWVIFQAQRHHHYHHRQQQQFRSPHHGAPRAADTDATTTASTLAPKRPSESIVTVTYPVSLDMCDPEPTMPTDDDDEEDHAMRTDTQPRRRPQRMYVRAGALMKMVDVVAGVAARRHAQTQCVTVSVDNVVFLAPIAQDCLIHLSACVNRAWGSSMEVGVKVVREDVATGETTYVSHSYLTFVAVGTSVGTAAATTTTTSGGRHGARRGEIGEARRGSAETAAAAAVTRTATGPASWARRLLSVAAVLGGDGEQGTGQPRDVAAPGELSSLSTRPRAKLQVPAVLAETRLERRRHLLAGRRRSRRIELRRLGQGTDGVSHETKSRVRRELLQLAELEATQREAREERERPWERRRREAVMRELELEFISRAWADGDAAVRVVRASGSSKQGSPHPSSSTAATSRDTPSKGDATQNVWEWEGEQLVTEVREEDLVVEINLPGDEPIRHSLREVRQAAMALGLRIDEQDECGKSGSEVATQGVAVVSTPAEAGPAPTVEPASDLPASAPDLAMPMLRATSLPASSRPGHLRSSTQPPTTMAVGGSGTRRRSEGLLGDDDPTATTRGGTGEAYASHVRSASLAQLLLLSGDVAAPAAGDADGVVGKDAGAPGTNFVSPVAQEATGAGAPRQDAEVSSVKAPRVAETSRPLSSPLSPSPPLERGGLGGGWPRIDIVVPTSAAAARPGDATTGGEATVEATPDVGTRASEVDPGRSALERATDAAAAVPRDDGEDDGVECIAMADTLATSLHLVFPEHSNSHGILFGGQTIAWMEECALVSASRLSTVAANAAHPLGEGGGTRRPGVGSGDDGWAERDHRYHHQPTRFAPPLRRQRRRAPRFSTVALDGLDFKRPVRVGEAVTLTSVAVRSFGRSAEVYVVAEAEGVGGGGGAAAKDGVGARVVTNDALFVVSCGGGVDGGTERSRRRFGRYEEEEERREDGYDDGAEDARAIYGEEDMGGENPPSNDGEVGRLAAKEPLRRLGVGEGSGTRQPPTSASSPSPPLLKRVVAPAGTALEAFAAKAELRRAERLEMRGMLSRLYGGGGGNGG